MRTYTIFAYWTQHYATEEVDVQASSYEEARAKATDILNADYLPGWEIDQIVERPTAPGWTSFF